MFFYEEVFLKVKKVKRKREPESDSMVCTIIKEITENLKKIQAQADCIIAMQAMEDNVNDSRVLFKKITERQFYREDPDAVFAHLWQDFKQKKDKNTN